MNYFLQSSAIGLALFSMFFGAGNIVFPLAVGQYAGDKSYYALFGLLLTAVLMPILGVIAMVLFDGNYRRFFGRLGKIPGLLIGLLLISLLGPLGSTPRCIALAHTTFTYALGIDISMTWFNIAFCFLIFLATIRKNHLITILGWVLTPALLISLTTVICLGIFSGDTQPQHSDQAGLSLFLHGVKEGYHTMDLLAAFFFSSSIVHILKARASTYYETKRIMLLASCIVTVLLSTIYIGFGYLSAHHGQEFIAQGKAFLLSGIMMKVAGPYAGPLICITVCLACATTAIAIIHSFADYLQEEIFVHKVRYEYILIGSLLLTFFVANFQFTAISTFLSPLLNICYPGLIIFTALNLAYRLWGFQSIKTPVFLTVAFMLFL